MSYEVRIEADSIPAHNQHRLTTFVVTFPRFILAEFNTHRMLSRNAASSRAIPVKARLREVRDNPFIPAEWGANQAGMQAGASIMGTELASSLWLEARDKAMFVAGSLASMGVHKQLVNRLLEPFSWVTVVVTATDWDNFFHLRTDVDAQPEFRVIATLMRNAYFNSVPTKVHVHDWHLPFIKDEDRIGATTQDLIKISAGRCARVSYLTHDGKRDPIQDVMLANSLQANGHMSPFEHPAICQEKPHRVGNFIGWTQCRKLIVGESDPKGPKRHVRQ